MTDDGLTPELRARLAKLRSEIRLTQITVSFSIDDRDVQGRRKSAFFSENAVRQDAEEPWTLQEVSIVECLVAKHVVSVVYRDAVMRGIVSVETATKEAKTILGRYDRSISKLLEKDKANEP